jgi:hypothetical protein
VPLVIALDYDNTYTDAEELWDEFITAASKRGHVVVCVTFRTPDMPVKMSIPVFYTSGKLKADFMREVGLEPSIWIDDMPELIGRA